MGLKKWHGTAGMATNDSKMGWYCDSNRQKRKWENANSDMAFSSIRKTTGFEIQTWDIRNPSKRASLSTFWAIGTNPVFSPPPAQPNSKKRLLVHHVKTRGPFLESPDN